jgi:hypothetical protein
MMKLGLAARGSERIRVANPRTQRSNHHESRLFPREPCCQRGTFYDGH